MDVEKLNCWDYMGCDYGPATESENRCPVANAKEYDGINSGLNGGRYCWHVDGALCQTGSSGLDVNEPLNCASCDFLAYVREQEDHAFRQ